MVRMGVADSPLHEHLISTKVLSMRACLAVSVALLLANTVLAIEPQDAEQQLASKISQLKPANPDLLADIEVWHKGVIWARRYDQPLSANDVEIVNKSVTRGLQRTDALAANRTPWTTQKGRVVRGYVSAVDGSTQPYGVVIPQGYDGSRPMRLDVVLHGSSKPVGMSELRFCARHDGGDEITAAAAPEVDYIELHPLGRVENCYRWAGETDVFEAIEAVCRNYNIDRNRIVLRGMSMGASGTWHLGLKHPDRFVALGPYCGYVDTHRFSETPIANFIKVGPLPWIQEQGLHMLDSVDYAANAGVVPAIAAIGDQDVFFQAHVIMGEAFAQEGLQMVNLVSRGTGHVIDPVTHAEQMRQIGEYAAKGINHAPRQIRFVTWTLKYNRCHWIELLGLKHHYARAEVNAKVSDDGSIEIVALENITRFAIHPPLLQNVGAKLRIAGVELALPKSDEAIVFERQADEWRCLGPRSAVTLTGKRPRLQGPIDDAFTAPFVCVRGTGKPWNPDIHAWAIANLRRFEYEWARYMRGDLPVKNDTDVTADDVKTKHLILFGDPGSNLWIAKALPSLPLKWTSERLSLGDATYSAVDHAPAFIAASPIANDRYLVINSGHTFHEKEFAAFNYLLFPRLGDWSVTKVAPVMDQWQPSMPDFSDQVIRAGFFDETWQKTVLDR